MGGGEGGGMGGGKGGGSEAGAVRIGFTQHGTGDQNQIRVGLHAASFV